MATKRKTYLITTNEDVSAVDIAENEVSTLLGGAEIADGVSLMQGEDIPSESTVLTNEDFGIITATLSKKDADELAKKKGIEFVEEDEEVFASSILDQDGNPFDADDFIDDDSEAAEEIDYAADLAAADSFTDEEAAAMAALASEHEPEDYDDVDFDEAGNAFALSGSQDPDVVDTFAGMGIPKEKVLNLLKCVINCVGKEFSNGTANEVSDAQVEAIMARQGLIGSQESVQAIRDYITCGLKIIYAKYAWRYSTGSGVRVAVVDTGIANRHPDLRVYGGVSYVPGVRSWNDDQGHGTHVAGSIAATINNRGVVGVAPHARLYAVKVLNRNGSGTTSGVINGLTWCYRNRMHVANLSLGSGATTHSTSNYSRAYERAGRLLRSRGILAVAAAGNSGATSRPYVSNPGRCPSFMAVAAVDCKRKRARFSSFGPQVEISAPGVNVLSTYPRTAYKRLSGTSMASPHVAGVAALIKRRHPSWHGDRIRVHMWRNARDLGVSGRDWAYGYGLVDAYRSVR